MYNARDYAAANATPRLGTLRSRGQPTECDVQIENPVLRYLPLRLAFGAQRVEQCHAACLPDRSPLRDRWRRHQDRLGG
jgi:hypothetical protein